MNHLVLAICLAISMPQTDEISAVKLSDYTIPCGLNSFYSICRLLDVSIEWESAKNLLGQTMPDGTHSFEQIANAANSLGLHPIGLKSSIERIYELPMPAIVHVRDLRRPNSPTHLLVLVSADETSVILLDPPGSAYSLPLTQFESVWTGNILVFAQSELQLQELRSGAMKTKIAVYSLYLAIAFAITAIGLILIFNWRIIMTRRLIISIPVSLAIIAVVIIWYTIVNREPKCELSNSDIDLGQLKIGPFMTEVSLLNSGNSTLLISAVRSSCTCTSVKAPKKVEPRETATIYVTVNVSGGPQHAVLTIESNDHSSSKKVYLSWVGEHKPVLHPVNIEPQTVRGDIAYRKILQVIYTGGDNSLRPSLESVECDSPYVKVTEADYRSVAQPASASTGGRTIGELDLLLEIKPPSQGITVNSPCYLIIRQGKEKYRLQCRLMVKFLGSQLIPESDGILFSASLPSELVEQVRTLRIFTSDYSGKLKLEGLPSWVTCEQETIDKGQCLLHFRVKQSPDSGQSVDCIRLGIPGEPSSIIPIKIHHITAR